MEAIRLHERPPIEVLPIFNLNFHANAGVSFGLFRAGSTAGVWALTALAAAIAAFFGWWMKTSERLLTTAALGLVIGGALGNMIDRLRFGYVVDFLDFHGLGFPWVFNVADSAITVGAVLLVLDYFTNPEHRDEPKAKPAAGEKAKP
jgi:signal peptidase II